VIASATVTRWFERQRGLALALVLAGFNVSFVTAGPVAVGLIELFGWRGAFLAFGAWLCLVGGIATLVVRDPPWNVLGAMRPARRADRGITRMARLAHRRP